MKTPRFEAVCAGIAFICLTATTRAGAYDTLPDGRSVTPAGFVIPVEGFASSEAMSPDGQWIAVLSQDGQAVDVIAVGEDARLVDRLAAPFASGMTWTKDGLYVSRGYTGAVSRYTYQADLSKDGPAFVKRADLEVGGLVNGVWEDPATHALLVARTAAHEIDVIDDNAGSVTRRLTTAGEPFDVAVSGSSIVSAQYNADKIELFPQMGAATPVELTTGAHPTKLLVSGDTAYVANADDRTVSVVDVAAHRVVRTLDLSVPGMPYMGQTPSGMAISDDARTLFVAESGFNDVAVVDLSKGHAVARIPTGWYPTAVLFGRSVTIDKDPRLKPQLWVLSAQGLGPQPDPGGEWNGWYTGLLQHLVIEPNRFDTWTKQVAADNHFRVATPAAGSLPPIRHVVFIVQENKHFDEVFGDEARANADPSLLVYGRHYTPNAHALAERYALFDDLSADGQASIYGHSWTTQGIANDYLQRNAHTPDDPASASDRRVASSIWPYAMAGEDTVSLSEMDFDWFKDLDALPKGPRINVSAVFGPRGELIDALRRKGVSFRVYGEQMTMLPSGRIAPGLASHADTEYPGAHIDFGVLDTDRAKLFLDDVAAHGLAAYSYMTLPTNHTAGTKAGFYTPASYVANNDAALGEIVQGLSKRPEWRSTVVIVTEDDAQGTGDHLDSHRMPAFAIGPYVRRSFVDHTHYDIVSILRTVEVLYGVPPLNMYDAEATPMTAAFSMSADASPYAALPAEEPMVKNPGKAKSLVMELDGPDSAAIPAQEWESVRGGVDPAGASGSDSDE